MANVFTKRLLSGGLNQFKNFSRVSRRHARVDPFIELNRARNFSSSASTLFQWDKFRHAPLFFSKSITVQQYSKDARQLKSDREDEKKLSLFQRFKQMYKEYWYVLVPVHLVTSVAWFGGFYYLAKSGVDIVALLESWNISERITNPLKDSSMGYLAVAYALYKLSTPARYTVTLGGTTISINYLKKWGYIKPVPSAERLKEMYKERKDDLLGAMRETREELKVQSEKLKDKKENMIDDFDKSIKQIKEIGDKIKTKQEHVIEKVKEGMKGSKN